MIIDVAGMKRTCRSEMVPQGVSSVQGDGREALPAHVSTCATASPSPANEGPKLTMLHHNQLRSSLVYCHNMTRAVNVRRQYMPGQEHSMHNANLLG